MIKIDLERGLVSEDGADGTVEHRLDTPAAFAIVSKAWVRAGWDTKYMYGFSWLGRPIIQLPEDMVRIQEVIHRLAPDVIIETGIAHGGSLIFYASLCKALDKGRVVGIDLEIRPHNRAALEAHLLAPLITLIEGSSTDPATLAQVRAQVRPGDRVLVLLDSCHTKAHVLDELRLYSPLVSPGSYIVATDGIMEELAGAPRTGADWAVNNPRQAALAFAQENPDFVIEEPPFPFNEGSITQRVTHWPSAFLKRRESPL